jgi:hypothetical protein
MGGESDMIEFRRGFLLLFFFAAAWPSFAIGADENAQTKEIINIINDFYADPLPGRGDEFMRTHFGAPEQMAGKCLSQLIYNKDAHDWLSFASLTQKCGAIPAYKLELITASNSNDTLLPRVTQAIVEKYKSYDLKKQNEKVTYSWNISGSQAHTLEIKSGGPALGSAFLIIMKKSPGNAH